MADTLTSTNTTLTGTYNTDSLVETLNNHNYYAAVFGPQTAQTFTVTNQGDITAPTTGRYVDGILLAALGTVINQGTIIVGGGDGIQLQSGGAATNTGFIQAVSIGIASTSGYVLNAGTIISQTGVNEATGTVKNTGLIATSTLNGDGIVLANGGAVFNTGTITGEQGILIPLNTGAPVYINNRGAISVKGVAEQLGKSGLSVNGGTITAGGDGIDLTASGTVLNDGQISATRFAISATQYLSLSNLGTITGPITAATAGIFNDGAITGLIHASDNASLTNYGTIAGTNASIGFASGAVFNAGIIDESINFTAGAGDVFNTGLIQALQQTGINIFAAGTVDNIGIIRAGAGIQDAAALTLTNAGTIDAYTAYGVLLRGGGTVSNTGIIQAKSYGVGARQRATITNGGDIAASAGAGVILRAGGTVTNTGTISALTAISIVGTAAIINDSTILGAITATGATSLDNNGLITAFPGNTGASYVNLGSGNLTNTGAIMEAIEVSSGLGTIANAGLLYAVTAASSLALTNTGTIAGSISTAGTISLNNFGLIDGAALNLGGGIVLNTNTILGAVALSGSGDVTNFGLIQGGIGSGVELEAGGSAANFGTIQGLGYGIGLKTGGTATNQGYIQANYAGIGAGGVGTNVSYATIYNSGQISAEISGIRLDAGTVTNTGTIDHCDQGIILFDGGSVNNAGLIDASKNINLSTAVDSDYVCVVTNTGTVIGNTGLYLGGGIVTNSGIIQGTGTDSSGIDISYLSYGATSIQNTGTITAYDGITSTATAATTTITNTAGATIASANRAIFVASAATITNQGYISGAIFSNGNTSLDNAGTISDASGTLVLGAGTLLNSGLIKGTVEFKGVGTADNLGTIQNTNRYGIDLRTGGTATNQGYIQDGYVGIESGYPGSLISQATISNSGQISGGEFGIKFDAGTVTNTGTLSHTYYGILNLAGGSVNNAGLIDANAKINQGAAVFAENNCTLTNTGTLIGNSGLYLDSGLITNSGIIQGTGTKSNGIFLFGGASSIQNTGTITADTGIRTSGAATITNAAHATIAGATIAIELAAGSTLTNAGAITGATAISFAAGASDRLIISPTSTITGSINGGGGTLELAAATTPGTFTAAEQTQFANFAALQVDQGAVWDFSGTQTLASATLQNNGTIDQSAHTTLTIKDAITGNGTIKLAAGALALENTVAGQIIDFTGTGETLALADPHQFTGKIEHFAAGDTIDLTSISLSAITATHFVHSVLTITEAGTNLFFTFSNPGTFAQETFKLTQSGHGTDITLSAAGSHLPVTPLTTLTPLPTFTT